MEKLYTLKDRYMDELEKLAEQPYTAQSLDLVHKLSGSVKNICKIIKQCEEEESEGGYSGRSYSYAREMDSGVEPGRANDTYRNSYARGRMGVSRDSMGRYSGEMGYSRHGDPAGEIRRLMDRAPDEQTRRDLERIARRMEQA